MSDRVWAVVLSFMLLCVVVLVYTVGDALYWLATETERCVS